MNMIGDYTASGFTRKALEIFRMQAETIPVYKRFLSNLNIDPGKVPDLKNIPFLPVELFKDHRIISPAAEVQLVFESSGTTGQDKSRHFIADKNLYNESILEGFSLFYGDPGGYIFLGLLPSYLERKNASLVYMVNQLIRYSGHPESGFYLQEYDKLIEKLQYLKRRKEKTLLIGVSFALLDLAERYKEDLSGLIIMETGGMKGKRAEITREELHDRLTSAFHLDKVHSEYGMTELLSQSYSKGDGKFFSPPWVKIMIRDSHDPLFFLENGKPGLINIIDLANIHSCSFIATSDIGRVNNDGSFEVLGRMDNSDIRGCNLLVI